VFFHLFLYPVIPQNIMAGMHTPQNHFQHTPGQIRNGIPDLSTILKQQKHKRHAKSGKKGYIVQQSREITISGIFSSGDLPQSHESPSRRPQY
jgi:hypothetical protein